jgi:hypothetical protein
MAPASFSPQQLLASGQRAEAEGKLDYALQLYRHVNDHYAYTPEGGEARSALARLGAAGMPNVWGGAPNGHAPAPRSSRAHQQARLRPALLRERYRAASLMAGLVSALGWLIAGLGLILPVLHVGIGPPLRLEPVEMLAGAAGALLGGMLLALLGQVARALFDQANAARELLAIERARHGADHG